MRLLIICLVSVLLLACSDDDDKKSSSQNTLSPLAQAGLDPNNMTLPTPPSATLTADLTPPQ